MNPECGHERDSHHFDDRGPGNCLCMRCECPYFHAAPPKPGVKSRVGDADDVWGVNKPHSDTSCMCRDCSLWYASKRGGYGIYLELSQTA